MSRHLPLRWIIQDARPICNPTAATDPDVSIGRKEWKLEKFSSITREEINWIFASYLAKGKITGLSGEPGAAKSLVSLDWAARYSTGRGWPDGAKSLQPAGKVLIFATEDGAADTILPRFLAAGGNPDNLLRIRLEGDTGFCFDDPKHLDILRIVTEQNPDIGLVIIDPISRAAAQLVLTGGMQQDKRGRSTFWKLMPTEGRQ